MRITAAIALVLGLGAWAVASDDAAPESETPAWDDVPVQKLWEAVKEGDAEASGSQPRSYRQVKIRVKNRSGKRSVIDLAGSHLRPRRRGSCQRLGLGPPVVANLTVERGPGTVCLQLEPGEEKTLVMNTVCLDAGRSAPNNHSFQAVPEPLPPVRAKVLRWWVDHPEASQSAVNSAIWRNRERVILDGTTPQQRRRIETRRQGASHGGVYFQLKDNELTSLDTDDVRRVLGSQVWQIFPTEDAVYAVMPGDDLRPDLWRLAPTGENPWGFVCDLTDDELLDVVPAGGGDLVLLYAGQVTWFDHSESESKKLIAPKTDRFLSARVGKRTGKVYVTVHDPRDNGVTRGGAIEGQSAGRFEIWVIDPKRGKAEMKERVWNVSAIRAGGAGIYGLSHKGNIRRYAQGKFKDLGPVDEYASLIAVGSEKVWLLTESGKLAAAHPQNGRRLFTSDAQVNKEMWFTVDPVTDDLVFATRKGFFAISGEDGTERKIDEVEEPEEETEAD
jgi:outer membrane protein assembly factor BamB